MAVKSRCTQIIKGEISMNNKIKSECYTHHIFINDIVRNPNNPFKNLEDGSFVKLLNSIRNFGIIEPVAVREIKGKYEIISGQRRVYAAEILGMRSVPAIVFEVNEDEAIILTADSNLTFSGVSE